MNLGERVLFNPQQQVHVCLYLFSPFLYQDGKSDIYTTFSQGHSSGSWWGHIETNWGGQRETRANSASVTSNKKLLVQGAGKVSSRVLQGWDQVPGSSRSQAPGRRRGEGKRETGRRGRPTSWRCQRMRQEGDLGDSHLERREFSPLPFPTKRSMKKTVSEIHP